MIINMVIIIKEIELKSQYVVNVKYETEIVLDGILGLKLEFNSRQEIKSMV